MTGPLNRREMLGVVGAAAAGAMLGSPALAQGEKVVRKNGKLRTVRVAHLTDIHVQPELRANEGMIACLRDVREKAGNPDLLLIGGDCIMDGFEADDARTKVQWDLYRSILKGESSLRSYAVIGNHDIWGWSKRRSGCTGAEADYGKKRAMDMLELPERYSSFDINTNKAGAWHFVRLDSVQSDGGEGYRAQVDDEQFDWLARDLAAVDSKTPILVLSHIPLLSGSAGLFAKRSDNGDATVRGSLVHSDSRKLVDLFAKHPNVKVCLSGHLHHHERVDYNGVSYLCSGAVCGAWWKGRHHHCAEGYSVIDLFNDGSFEQRYNTYGWTADAS